MPGGALDGPEARGQRLARRQCSGCHAVGAIDLSPLAKAPPVRQLGARYDAAALERWVGEIARGGHGDMPFFQLGPTDAADLAAFIAASARR
jgi:mono/diheme cytochrome c family protein